MNSPNPCIKERDAILKLVMNAAGVLTQGWDRAFSNPITPDTYLFADLGCQSLDFAVLIADLSRGLQRNDIPIERVMVVAGKSVTDISLRMLADFLWEHARETA